MNGNHNRKAKMRNMVIMVTYFLVLIMTCRGLVEGKVPPCNETLFYSNVNQFCFPNFTLTMETSGFEERCPWPAMKGTYNSFMECVDYVAENISMCSRWMYMVEGVSLGVHARYFSACGVPVPLLDPPLGTLVLLIAPGILFTFLLPLICLRLVTFDLEMPGCLGL